MSTAQTSRRRGLDQGLAAIGGNEGGLSLQDDVLDDDCLVRRDTPLIEDSLAGRSTRDDDSKLCAVAFQGNFLTFRHGIVCKSLHCLQNGQTPARSQAGTPTEEVQLKDG